MTSVTDGRAHDAHGAAELLQVLNDATASDAAPRSERWEAIEQAALQHGLAPLLHQRLRASTTDHPGPPVAVRERLRDVYVHSVLRAAATRDALHEVLRALRAAEIEVVVLKGAALAEHVYADPGLRPMRDVDLLVPRAELERTREVLTSLGYAAAHESHPEGHHHLPAFVRPGALPIEVHWTLARPGLAADAGDHAWGSARAVEVAGVAARTLAPEALLHHLCVHVAHGHRFWVPLLHLHDLAAVIRHHPELDWDRLAAIARAHGSTRFVYAALALAQRAFPSLLPASAAARIAALPHGVGDGAVVDAVWEALMGPTREFPRLLARVEAAADRRARARLLWEHLFPPPARLRLDPRVGARPIAWAYALRVGDVLRRGRHAALAFLSGTDEARATRAHARRRAVVERWVCGGEVA